jgi:hypothetical protein
MVWDGCADASPSILAPDFSSMQSGMLNTSVIQKGRTHGAKMLYPFDLDCAAEGEGDNPGCIGA